MVDLGEKHCMYFRLQNEEETQKEDTAQKEDEEGKEKEEKEKKSCSCKFNWSNCRTSIV